MNRDNISFAYGVLRFFLHGPFYLYDSYLFIKEEYWLKIGYRKQYSNKVNYVPFIFQEHQIIISALDLNV